MTDQHPPRRPLLTKGDRAHLRALADNAEAFTVRADGFGDPDAYDVGYGTAAVDVFRWLAGDESTDYLIETLTDWPS